MLSLAAVTQAEKQLQVSGEDEAHTAYSLMVPEARPPAAPLPLPITFSTGPGDGKVAENRARRGGCERGSARVRQFKVSARGGTERSGGEGAGGETRAKLVSRA